MKDIKIEENDFNFAYRVSAIIYNRDKSKILLFYGNDMNFYMLPGGKVQRLEKSEQAIKREIKEELGFDNLSFKLTGISEEIIKRNDENIQEITFTYECIYYGKILDKPFKSIENDWIDFIWIDLKDIDKYVIHPTKTKEIIKNEDLVHIVEEI